MTLKRNALTVLILGFFMSILGFIAPIVCWNHSPAHNETIGTIGGADTPTHTLMLSALFDGLPIVLILLGISLIVSAVFCLVFSKTVRQHCHIHTSAISLGLSGVGALGLACAFLWFSIVSFGEMAKYPIEYPGSVLLGSLCFLVFVLLIVIYLKARIMNWSIQGFCIDVLTSVIYLPAFFFACSYLYHILDYIKSAVFH